VFEVSLGQMLWSRRTIFMLLVVGLPVVIALGLRLLVELGVPVTRVGRAEVSGPVVFGLMIWALFVRFSIPVLAVFYGTSLIADEIEDRTITYLFTRPVPRGAVLLGKYAAYLVCTGAVVLPAVVIVWLLIGPIGATLGDSFLDLPKDLLVMGTGLAAYGALFALVGAVLKRPLIMGLLFVFGWEWLALAMPGYLKRLTVAFYVEGLVPHAIPGGTVAALVQSLFREVPGLTHSLAGLTVIAVASLWLAVRAVSRREYVLEQ
jgi:ABC-type transport system involved in multi-copper enzyme maturation permease subunit